jgi:hypothetical protein
MHIRAKVTRRSLDRGIESRLGVYRVRVVLASRDQVDLELKLSSDLETFTNIRLAIYMRSSFLLASVLPRSLSLHPSIISIIRFAHSRHSPSTERNDGHALREISAQFPKGYRKMEKEKRGGLVQERERDSPVWLGAEKPRSYLSGRCTVGSHIPRYILLYYIR